MSQVYGIHAVQALLESQPERVRTLLLQEGRDDARLQTLEVLARDAGIQTQRVARKRLDKLSRAHQGAVAECHPLTLASDAELEHRWSTLASPRLLLVLDSTDSRNQI